MRESLQKCDIGVRFVTSKTCIALVGASALHIHLCQAHRAFDWPSHPIFVRMKGSRLNLIPRIIGSAELPATFYRPQCEGINLPRGVWRHLPGTLRSRTLQSGLTGAAPSLL